jgi:hypothetical protein
MGNRLLSLRFLALFFDRSRQMPGQDTYTYQAMAAFFPFLSNSSFIRHPLIRRHTVRPLTAARNNPKRKATTPLFASSVQVSTVRSSAAQHNNLTPEDSPHDTSHTQVSEKLPHNHGELALHERDGFMSDTRFSDRRIFPLSSAI